MNKDDRQPLDDELRPEYKRSDFGELVRGKYVDLTEKTARLTHRSAGRVRNTGR